MHKSACPHIFRARTQALGGHIQVARAGPLDPGQSEGPAGRNAQVAYGGPARHAAGKDVPVLAKAEEARHGRRLHGRGHGVSGPGGAEPHGAEQVLEQGEGYGAVLGLQAQGLARRVGEEDKGCVPKDDVATGVEGPAFPLPAGAAAHGVHDAGGQRPDAGRIVQGYPAYVLPVHGRRRPAHGVEGLFDQFARNLPVGKAPEGAARTHKPGQSVGRKACRVCGLGLGGIRAVQADGASRADGTPKLEESYLLLSEVKKTAYSGGKLSSVTLAAPTGFFAAIESRFWTYYSQFAKMATIVSMTLTPTAVFGNLVSARK